MIQVTYSQIFLDPSQLPSLSALLLLSRPLSSFPLLNAHLSLAPFNSFVFCFLHLQDHQQFLAENKLAIESSWIGQELFGGALRISLEGQNLSLSLYGKRGKARLSDLVGKELLSLFAAQNLISQTSTSFELRQKQLRERLSAFTFMKAFKRQKAEDFLSALSVTQYSKGQLVAIKGHQADRLFFLIDGLLGTEGGLAIKPGGWFGAQSLDTLSHRQDVKALQPSLVAWMKLADFNFVVGAYNSSLCITKYLGKRFFERGTLQEVIELLEFWSRPTRQLRLFRFYLTSSDQEQAGVRTLDRWNPKLRICDSPATSTQELLQVDHQVLKRLLAFRLDFQRMLIKQDISLEQILK